MITRLQNRQRLPRLGKIRLGVQEHTAEGKPFPKEVAWFVVPDELKLKYGERPTALPIMFPTDDVEALLPTRYERYAGGLLIMECDGIQAIEIPKKGPELVYPCKRPPGEPGKPTPACECRAEAKGRLNVIVLGGRIGTYQVVLGGEQRLADILSELEVFRRLFGSLTRINGHPIPFTLTREESAAQIRNAAGERIARTGWPVHVRCAFTAEMALEASGMRLLEVTAGRGVPAMPALGPGLGGHVDPARAPDPPRASDTGAEQMTIGEPPEGGDDEDPDDPLASQRETVWGLFFDAAGQNTRQALALVRRSCKQHLRRDVEGLGDLSDAELRTMARAMSDGR